MPSKKDGTTSRAPKRPTDPVMFIGELDVRDDVFPPDDTTLSVVAILVKFSDRPHPILVVNAQFVTASRRRMVEMWARRHLGAGALFKALLLDDLRAVPGLFEVAA